MANIIFFYDNEWDKVSDVVCSSEHPNFPAENTQHRDFNKPWRSLYGAGSGWGFFEITATNNLLYFKDSGGTPRIATITIGFYNAGSLVPEIKTQMEAVCGDTFTPEYLESGANKNKFKITDNTGIFELTCTSTVNAIWDVIGFSTAANKTGADNYVADYIRIHTEARLKVNLGSAKSILAFLVRGHNIQTGSTLKIQGNATDTWATPSVNYDCLRGTKFIGKIFPSAQTYQWWRHTIADMTNPAGYVEEGRVFLGPGFQPTRNFVRGDIEPIDPSMEKSSEGGQISTIQRSKYEIRSYVFQGTKQLDEFNAMFEAVGISRELFIVENPDSLLATVKYVQFINWRWNPIPGGVFRNLTISYKELV